jgi:NTP pyrophosphatase (non-canonical NTP hydrolase)
MNEKSDRAFGELVEVMKRLRAPGGCPWDREQTMESLRAYIVEEAYELVDAVTRADLPDIKEECGDVLLQVVFLSQIAAEEGRFSVEDVIHGLVEKLVRRHPHVFADADAATSTDVLRNWEQIKTQGAVPHWWQTVGVSVHVSSSEWILIRDRSGEYVPPWAALQASSHALHLVHFDGSVTRRTRGVASSAAAWEGPFSAPSPMRSTR